MEKARPSLGREQQPRRKPRQFAELPCYDSLASLVQSQLRRLDYDFGFRNQPPLPRRLAPKRICRRLQASDCGKATAGDLPQAGSYWLTGVATGFGTMNEEPQIILGERHGWGEPQRFGISREDQRQHIYIIGKTGSGKTTLLRNMLVQHIALGHGVGLIDPHGDLAEEILDHIPPHRADHLVYFNPGDLEYPTAFNLLAGVAPDDRHLVASGIVGAFKSIWRDSWGPRMEYILYNAIAALLDCNNVTLLGVNRILTDERYRAWVIRQIKDPFIKSFWADEYASYDLRFQREAIAPIQNKLGQFLLNPVIRNILGQVKAKVSIPFVMENRRIFIANLSKGYLGHDKANLLGCLLTTQFQLAAMARAAQPESQRRDFYLLIDEFQNFSTDAFAWILAEARKYRLCLVLSHQYVDQLSLPIRQAIFGNLGTLIILRTGHPDAQVFADELGRAFSAAMIADLERYEAVLKLLENGSTKEPFRARMLPDVTDLRGNRRGLILRSRKRFTTSRAIVNDKIRRWLAAPCVCQLPALDQRVRPNDDNIAAPQRRKSFQESLDAP